MTDPRPFHIGSEVRRPEAGPVWEVRDVEYDWCDMSNPKLRLRTRYDDADWWDYATRPISDYVHASDGAPLGEFVPISERVKADAWVCHVCGKADLAGTNEQLAAPEHVSYRGCDIGTCNGEMIPLYTRDKLNALIRGEEA